MSRAGLGFVRSKPATFMPNVSAAMVMMRTMASRSNVVLSAINPALVPAIIKNKMYNDEKKLVTDTITVTPALAREWLGYNVANRPQKSHQSDQIAADMRAGAYRLNGEAIKFGEDGRLLDGQNRLFACIRANTPFRTLVVYGVEDEAQSTMDGGSKRTLADNLGMMGEKNTAILAGVLRMYISYKRSDPPTPYVQACKDHRPSTSEGIAALKHRGDEIRASVTFAVGEGRMDFLPGTQVGILHFLFSHVDPEEARDFFLNLKDGIGLEAFDPIFILRERLIRDKGAATRLPTLTKMAFVIKAFNAWRVNRPMRQLKWYGGEEFPQIDDIEVVW